MIINNKLGGRTVQLFIPFEHGHRTITEITLSPFRFGDTLRWNEGAFKSTIALMVELSGEDETVIRSLRYPDTDRVMEAFIALLPPDIRNDITEGRVPVPREPRIVTNGSGAAKEVPDEPVDLPAMASELASLRGPGVPLPEAGFDLSEEE